MHYVQQWWVDVILFSLFSLQDDHHNMVQYEMKLEHVSLSELFAKLEENQTRLNIVDYSVSHTTLDNLSIRTCITQ